MPVARFQMPDGRVARFEVPEGTSPEQAQSMMQGFDFSSIDKPVEAAQPTEQKAESFLGGLPLTPLDALGSPQEIGRQLLRTGRAAGAGIAGLGDIVNAPIDAMLGMAGSDFRFGSPSQTVRQGFDTATQGTAFSTAPQNATERVVDTASEFVAGASPFKMAQAAIAAPQAAQGLARLAPQTAQELTSFAGAGAGAGVAKEVAPDSAIAPLVGALAGGAGTQMVLNAPAAMERGVRNIALGANARSGEDLAAQALQGKQAAGSIRNEITKMGVVVKPEKARDIVSNIDDALKEVDLIPELSPKTFNVVKRIRDLVDKGEGISLNYLDQYRRTLRSAVGEDSVAAGAVRRALDNAVNTAQEGDFIGRNGKMAVDLLNRFRKEYTQASKFDDIADIIVRGQGDGNFIKRELTKFMNKKENTMGFSKVEKAALSRAANLGNTMALGKILGKFGFDPNRQGSGVGAMFGGTTGGVIGLGAGGAGGAATGAAIVPAVGTAAKYGYNLATRGQAENLLRTIEGNAPKQLLPEVGNISRTTRALQSASPAMAQGLNAVQTPPVTLPNATQPSTMDVVPFEQLMPEAQPNTGTVQPTTREGFNPSPQSSITPDLIDAEGVRNVAYKDHLGNRTIGIGFNMDSPNAPRVWQAAGVQTDFNAARSGKAKLTPEEVQNLADVSYKIAVNDARQIVPNFDQLGENQKAALVQLSYQMGGQRLSGFKNMLNKLAQGDTRGAAYHLLNSKYAKEQTPARAKLIARMLAFDEPYKGKERLSASGIQQVSVKKQKEIEEKIKKVPPPAIEDLKQNPQYAADFDQVFGAGLSRYILA